MESNISLQLGDIIEIESPANLQLHNRQYFIEYIDNEKIVLVSADPDKAVTTILNIKPTGELYEESIASITILSRADSPSYAEQNGYIPGHWISIYFKGTFPIIINGVITDLINDMIEIKTYPKNDVIYIDFQYRGIPIDLNIDKITIIDDASTGQQEKQDGQNVIDEENIMQTGDDDDDYDYREQLQEVILEADAIEMGDQLESITQEIKVDEQQFRYSIEKQLDDLLDDILSGISDRNETTMNRINLEIERFRQLREKYSDFNRVNSIQAIKYYAEKHPLSNNMERLQYNLAWLLPVITNRREVFDIDTDENRYLVETTMPEFLDKIAELNNRWHSNQIGTDDDKYRQYIRTLYEIFQPYMPLDPDDSASQILSNNRVNGEIDVVIDNTDNLDNFGINEEKLGTRKYDTIILNQSHTVIKT